MELMFAWRLVSYNPMAYQASRGKIVRLIVRVKYLCIRRTKEGGRQNDKKGNVERQLHVIGRHSITSLLKVLWFYCVLLKEKHEPGVSKSPALFSP